jgi:hypothetical protein
MDVELMMASLSSHDADPDAVVRRMRTNQAVPLSVVRERSRRFLTVTGTAPDALPLT